MKKDLRLSSHKIDAHAWWYEEPTGISIVVEPQDTTEIKFIPWKKIRAALARLGKR